MTCWGVLALMLCYAREICYGTLELVIITRQAHCEPEARGQRSRQSHKRQPHPLNQCSLPSFLSTGLGLAKYSKVVVGSVFLLSEGSDIR